MSDLEMKVLSVLARHGELLSSAVHIKLAHDIKTLGLENVKRLARTMSPSQLGRMGFLGVRRLAQIRRDRGDAALDAILRDLEEVLK